jgi:4-hydroxyphenylpyruvate dioxygenase-like putative hemolysin
MRKIMRMQVVVAGLGMALMFAGATKAQEIVNTKFDDGPNVAAMTQPQPTAVQAKAVAATDAQAKMENATELAALRAADTTTNDEDKTSEREVWIGSFLIWVGAIGVYFCGPAKRFAQEMRAAREKYNTVQEA